MLRRNLVSILDDVIHCAEFISLRRDRTTLEKFLQDEETQAMFERKFKVIGEALGLLRKNSPEIFARIRHSKGAVDFRNVIIHAYSFIDHEAMWDIALRLLPELLSDAHVQRKQLI